MIEEIKAKIFKKINEKLDGDVSVSDLETFHKIINAETQNPVKFYEDMMNVFREKMETPPSFLGHSCKDYSLEDGNVGV